MHARAAGPRETELKNRVIEFVATASIEVTAHERGVQDGLAAGLAPGAEVYVTHTPRDSLADVVRVACGLERAGLRAWPHLVARRIQSEGELEQALGQMREAGISRALLVAGDLPAPKGPFAGTLDLLATGALARTGFTSLGVAGHPEGHRRIGSSALWEALREKQDYAELTGSRLHIVSQFSFDPDAIAGWDRRLAEHGIRLPVHAGIAGPASLRTLIKFAMLCGIGASLNAVMMNLSALGNVRHLATAAEQMLLCVVQAREGALARRIEKPHFFCFGGAARTAKWLRAIQRGAFEVDVAANTLVVSP